MAENKSQQPYLCLTAPLLPPNFPSRSLLDAYDKMATGQYINSTLGLGQTHQPEHLPSRQKYRQPLDVSGRTDECGPSRHLCELRGEASG